MSKPKPDAQKRRDELLLRLLKTPPQPRPKRDRGEKPTDHSAQRDPAAKRELSD